MSVVLISANLQAALTAALAGGFNGELEAACQALGIQPFAFNWGRVAGQPQNVYEGNRSFDQIFELEEPEFPAVTWWIGAGQDLNREKPRRFSGQVAVGWRFLLFVKGRRNTGLAAMRCAVEAALAATLVGMDVPAATYSKDLMWGDPVEQQWVDQDERHVGWLQELNFTANFEVSV